MQCMTFIELLIDYLTQMEVLSPIHAFLQLQVQMKSKSSFHFMNVILEPVLRSL